MDKRKKRKRKANIRRIFIFFAAFIFILFSIYTFFTLNIRNIYVINNSYLTDQKIIDLGGVKNYPKFFITSKTRIERKILMNPYIKNVTVEKKFYGKLYIYIEEEKPLFYKIDSRILVFGNKEEISEDNLLISVPVLANYVEEEYYDEFISQMDKLDDDVINKISQIEYKPNDIDPVRFVFYMKDGNYVYLTLFTFDKINNYNKIILELENEDGILYLDSGNYFDILD